VTEGHVRLNRVKVVKPGHAVAPGDILTVAAHGHVRVLKVEACSTRRGPAPEARQLYSEAAAPAPAMPPSDGSLPQKEDATPDGNC